MNQTLKKRLLSIVPAVVLIGAITFFTADVAYSLYEPDRAKIDPPECGVATISGDISVMAKDGLTWDAFSGDAVLEPGSRLRTASDSRASLTFGPGTMTTLEPGTDLIIDTITPGNGALGDTIILKQRSGKTWNEVEPRDILQDFVLLTTSAELKVKGTSFSAEIDDAGSTIVRSMNGLVQVYAEGKQVDLAAGYMTLVEEGKPPAQPYPIPAALNELSFSTNAEVNTLVTAPAGTSSGFAPEGSSINQIGSSLLSTDELGTRTVYLREPEPGNYTITVNGAPDSAFNLKIEGLIAGEPAFSKEQEITLNPAGKKVLYFSYSELAAGIDPAASSGSGAPAESDAGVKQPAGIGASEGSRIHSAGQSSPVVLRWIIITFIVVIAGGLVYWVRQS